MSARSRVDSEIVPPERANFHCSRIVVETVGVLKSSEPPRLQLGAVVQSGPRTVKVWQIVRQSPIERLFVLLRSHAIRTPAEDRVM